VSLGSALILHCLPPKGNPEPVVKWRKDGEILDLASDGRMSISGEGRLVVRNARKLDQGRYQCSAENAAGSRTSKPVKVRVVEAPAFVAEPQSQTVLKDEDVLLECQARGDPHPAVEWARADGEAISSDRARALPGKGLRIVSAQPEDSADYVCRAANGAGVAEVTAALRVIAPPVFLEAPEVSLQVVAGTGRASLRCNAVGSPTPLLFWTREDHSNEVREAMPVTAGSAIERLAVNKKGTLSITRPEPADSGLYACFAVNEAGSAVARSRLLVYDPEDFESGANANVYHDIDPLDEARSVMDSAEVEITYCEANDPDSVGLRWKTRVRSGDALSGFRVWWREADNDEAGLRSVDVPHPGAGGFEVRRLRGRTRYHFFVQPYHRTLSGTVFHGPPSPLASVVTGGAAPLVAPKVVDARPINASAIYLAWEPLDSDATRGNIEHYEVSTDCLDVHLVAVKARSPVP